MLTEIKMSIAFLRKVILNGYSFLETIARKNAHIKALEEKINLHAYVKRLRQFRIYLIVIPAHLSAAIILFLLPPLSALLFH